MQTNSGLHPAVGRGNNTITQRHTKLYIVLPHNYLFFRQLVNGPCGTSTSGAKSVASHLTPHFSLQTLIEKKQQLPDGQIRHRNQPLGEKMLPDEEPRQALYRALKEELGSVLPDNFQVQLVAGAVRSS